MSKRFTIYVSPSECSIEPQLPIRVVRAINKVTSFELPGAWVSGFGPRRRYLFSQAKQKFPVGLLKRVRRTIKKNGYRTKTIDYRDEVDVDEDQLSDVIDSLDRIPRWYQVEGIVSGIKYPYGLFWWPTGSGKTTLFSVLLLCYDIPSLILTHRRELLYQLKSQISAITDHEVGIIGDGKWKPKKWTVGIVNSFINKGSIRDTRVKEYLNTVEYLIIDECHHLGASTWINIARGCRNTKARHGFSGTCFRTDNADLLLLAHTGDVISKFTTSYMIDNGWLSRPHIYSDEINYKGETGSGSSWHTVQKELIVDNLIRNLKGCKFIYDNYCKNLQVLVMVNRIAHGHVLRSMLQGEYGVEGRDIRFMTGSEAWNVREKALEDYRSGVYPILIGTSIYDEGIDLPTVGAAANMAGGDSDIKTTQRLGRAIRKVPTPGEADVDPDTEQTVNYYDPFDKGHAFVRKHSKHRHAVYENEKAFVKCGAWGESIDKKTSKTKASKKRC